MTLLTCWSGVDTHGVSSLYLASDSRISWSTGAKFDFGRKVFAFSSHPDLLGYCGDVLFPSLALNQILAMGDAGLLFSAEHSCAEKFELIVQTLNYLQGSYPALDAGLAENSLSIIHASRGGTSGKEFFCRAMTWNAAAGWKGQKSLFPEHSAVLFSLGSGAAEFDANLERYQAGPNQRTCRGVYHCFCDTLAQTTVSTVGGAPQIAALYRKPNSRGRIIGSIFRQKRYFLGAQIDHLRERGSSVEWRNENFEICDGFSMQVAKDAQRQPDPLRRL